MFAAVLYQLQFKVKPSTRGHGFEISPWDKQSCRAAVSAILPNDVEQGDVIPPPQVPVIVLLIQSFKTVRY